MSLGRRKYVRQETYTRFARELVNEYTAHPEWALREASCTRRLPQDEAWCELSLVQRDEFVATVKRLIASNGAP